MERMLQIREDKGCCITGKRMAFCLLHPGILCYGFLLASSDVPHVTAASPILILFFPHRLSNLASGVF